MRAFPGMGITNTDGANIFIDWGSVFRTRQPVLRRASLVALALAGCSEGVGRHGAAVPKTMPPTEIGKRIASLPNYAQFSFSGAAFDAGRLYVTTNIGLIELQGTSVKSLHTWYLSDDVVEGPWVDKTSKSIWIQHVHDGALRRL